MYCKRSFGKDKEGDGQLERIRRGRQLDAALLVL
jgi:hypothetical protein